MSLFTHDPLLREFHRAGLYTDEERAARERPRKPRPSATPAPSGSSPTVPVQQLTRRQTVACLTLAGTVMIFATNAMAYSYGRAAESELTLQAYRTAEYATELLRQYIPQGERALASCIAADADFRAVLEGGPIWETRVRALLGETGASVE